MKIAFLSFYSGHVNRGVESFSNELATKLTELGHNIDLFQSGGNKEEKRIFNTITIPFRFSESVVKTHLIRKVFLDKNSRSIFAFTVKTIPYLIKGNYDVVISLNGGWQSLITRIITLWLGNKMVIVGQSGIGWDDRFNLMNFPDVFVATTKNAQKWAASQWPFTKVAFIPNGVDLNRFNPSKSRPKDVVLCVAALTKSKNIDLTIKAVSLMKTKVKLVIVGSGELKTYIMKLGTSLLKNRFFLKSVTHDKIDKIYKKATVFTLVSDSSESFGIVNIEALASNLPLVVTDDPQRREIVGDAGMFIDLRDGEVAYAAALDKAISRNWKDLPRLRAERFSWDKVVSEYEELLNAL